MIQSFTWRIVDLVSVAGDTRPSDAGPCAVWSRPGTRRERRYAQPARLQAYAPPQTFGELLEEPVFPNQVFRLFVIRQQAVYQFVAYGHFSSFENIGSYLPLDRLHKI